MPRGHLSSHNHQPSASRSRSISRSITDPSDIPPIMAPPTTDTVHDYRRKLYDDIQDLRTKLQSLEASKERLITQRKQYIRRKMAGESLHQDAGASSHDAGLQEEVLRIEAESLTLNEARLSLVRELRASYIWSTPPSTTYEGRKSRLIRSENKIPLSNPFLGPNEPLSSIAELEVHGDVAEESMISSEQSRPDRLHRHKTVLDTNLVSFQDRFTTLSNADIRGSHISIGATSIPRSDSLTRSDSVTRSNMYEQPRCAPEAPDTELIDSDDHSLSDGRSSSIRSRQGSGAWSRSSSLCTSTLSSNPEDLVRHASIPRKYNLSDDLMKYRELNMARSFDQFSSFSHIRRPSLNKALPVLHKSNADEDCYTPHKAPGNHVHVEKIGELCRLPSRSSLCALSTSDHDHGFPVIDGGRSWRASGSRPDSETITSSGSLHLSSTDRASSSIAAHESRWRIFSRRLQSLSSSLTTK